MKEWVPVSSSWTDHIAIRFDHVSKMFSGDRDDRIEALRDITGDVPKGAILTLVGPSGSGKSTLLTLCNLLATPDEGTVTVLGREIREWDPPSLRRTVGLVFQRPAFVPGTVLDNLALGARLQGRTIDNPAQHLQAVGLPENLLPRDARDLSGGQQQRLALARVLVNTPTILLLDEATSALDPSAARDIEALILDLRDRKGTTVLWVTHDLEQARRVGDWTWLLVEGRLVEARPTVDFFEHPEHPLTKRFLQGELSGGTQP
ncbi:MAG: phosphate ABC transporter ATP-binding protein [Alicyclobacillaceae bacterium]|nr:phosphate ABC transporter ATP-binding protein [Alicyclobacillaceae bacterium]